MSKSETSIQHHTSGTKIVYLDSNIFIYLIESPVSKYPMLFKFMQLVEQGTISAVTSDLTFGELLVKPYAEDAALADAYFELLNNSPVLKLAPVDREIIILAARLRSLRRGLKLPDAIHLATAEHYGCDAFMTNDRDVNPRNPMIRLGVSDTDISTFIEGHL